MSWITSSGQIYDGDCVPGDRAATQSEVNKYRYSIEFASLSSDYKNDVNTLSVSGWLSAAVSDGTSEETKKAAVVAAIATRKAQWQTDLAALKTKYGV